jgi:hypothetical protein
VGVLVEVAAVVGSPHGAAVAAQLVDIGLRVQDARADLVYHARGETQHRAGNRTQEVNANHTKPCSIPNLLSHSSTFSAAMCLHSSGRALFQTCRTDMGFLSYI